MADIALRTYLEEIDGLIDGNRIEEAITHLKHILGIYPKALDAYRLLAKALLEKNRHLDAADVFQRVLSSVPDDFISHIGMAVVREDEGNLDAAIWHMERAYEVQPNSQPIQEELRRLYGKRDGTKPPRLRLSRAALARMYEKGDLFPQAIGELRAALSDEPDRLDLKVLLATTLWRARQRAEAAETSAKLLEILPYCKDANRILANVWQESGRPQDAQSYRRRLEALDPYEAFADPAHNGHGAANVSPEQVLLPHLENVYGAAAADASRPDWMEALGIQYEEPTPAAAAPESGDWLNALGGTPDTAVAAGAGGVPHTDWLSALRGEDQPASSAADLFKTSAPTSVPPASPNEALDWLAGVGLSDAGVTPASGSDSPDWLTGVFPEQAPVTQAGPAADSQASDLPDWMQAEDVSASRPTGRAPTPPADDSAGTGMTGWLTALAGDLTASETSESSAASTDTGGVPDWLQQSNEAQSPRPSKTFGDLPNQMPDWMQPQAGAAPAAESSDVEVPEWLQGEATQSALTPIGDSVASDTAVPDWLGSADADSEPTPTETASQSQVPDWLARRDTTPAEPVSQSNFPDWLSAVDSGAGAASAPPPSDLPDWLSSADDTVVAKKAPIQPPPPANDLPPWLSEGQPLESPAEAEVPDWLGASASAQPTAAPSTELPAWLAADTDSAVAAADVPDWLTASATETPSAASAIPSPTAESDVPTWLQADASEAEAATDVPAWLTASSTEPETTAPDWLSESTPLSAADEMKPSDKQAEMSRADEEMPEWMKAAGWVPRDPSIPLDSASNVVAEEAEQEAETTEIPDWLKAMKPPEEARPAVNAAAAPDWLRSAMEGAVADQAKKPQTQPFEEISEWQDTSKPSAATAGETASWLASGTDIPDWLLNDEQESPVIGESSGPESATPGRDTAEAVAAYLREQAAPSPESATTPAPSEMSEDEALAWLEGLAAKQGASEEELVTKRSADLPEWLRKPVESEAEPESTIAPEPAPDALPNWLTTPAEPTLESIPPSESIEEEVPLAGRLTAEPASMSDDEALAWLEGLAAKQGANPEELVTNLPSESVEPAEEGLPDWLQAPVESAPLLQFEDSQATAPMELTPAPTAEPAAMSDDEALAWLEGLAVKQGANAEELVTQPEERIEEPPAWVQPETVTKELTPSSEAVTKPFESAPIKPEEPVAPLIPAASGLVAETPLAAEPASAPEMSADEALAWLEALAVKQGANAEELVTKPEARAEEMPAWIQSQADAIAEPEPTIEEVSEPAIAETASEEKPDWLKQMEAESDQYEMTARAPATEPGVQPEMSEDEALAWLEALAAKQGANAEELVTKPEARVEEMPAWIQSQAEAAAEAPPLAEPVAADEKPDWLKQMEAESDAYEATVQGPTSTLPEPAVEDETTSELPAWLAEKPVETQPEPKIQAAWKPSTRPLPPLPTEPAPSETPELPAWLSAATEPEPEPAPEPKIQAAWKPATRPLPPLPAEPAPSETPPELPAWLSTATEPEPEPAPEPKIQAAWKPATRPLPPLPPTFPEPTLAPAEEVPAWLTQPTESETPSWVPMTESVEPQTAAPEPVTPPPAVSKPKRAKKPRSSGKPRATPARRPSKLRRSEEPEIVLALARQRLSESNIDSAVEVYSELITSGHLTADVINDLEAAVINNADQPELLRTLGDAYMRENQLQKALDVYKQALLKL